jgi:hypothetical protein
MSARVHEPADDALTEIYDPERPRARMAPVAPGPSESSSAPVASAGRRPAPSTLPAPAGPPPPRSLSSERTPLALPRAPQPRPAPRSSPVDAREQPGPEVTPLAARSAVEYATPTDVDRGPGGALPEPPGAQAVPVESRRRLERSEPIRVISMKDHEATKPRAEVAGLHDGPVDLGNLAPPRDPRQARARRLRANVVWAGVAIVLACAISLAIWFIAGR